MPRRVALHDWDDDDSDEDDLGFDPPNEEWEPDKEWDPDDEEILAADGTIPCPWCAAGISEDAQRCPECGKYISEEDAPPQPKRWVAITAVLLLIFVLAFWVFNGV